MLALALSSLGASAESCYDSVVRVPSPYLNNGGETIILMDGTIWQDTSYNYSYAYEYFPSVTICPSGGFMIMKGKKISIIPIGTSAPERGKSSTPASPSQAVIESRIDGDFNGWEGETIFKLTNGQIWQQASYSYSYHYAFRPSILIIQTRGGYVMQVEGMSDKISVRRLR